MVCSKCATGRSAHSFENLGKTSSGVQVFYTCPARRDEFDDENFLEEFGKHLEETQQKPWIWIFDCKGYAAKHMLGLKDSLGLLRLFETTYKDSLHAMYVVNEAWYFHLFLKTVKPFMKPETKAKLHQISGSSLEAAVELNKREIPFAISKRIRDPIPRKI